jgi:hypothetical protein
LRLPRCIAAFSVAAFIKLEYVVGNSFEMKKYVPLQAAPSRRNVIIKILTDVDAALMFLWNGVIEEKGLIERRADRRKARLIHRAAILRRQLRVFVIAAAPCGGNVRKGSFHCENLQFINERPRDKKSQGHFSRSAFFSGLPSSGGCLAFQSSSREMILWYIKTPPVVLLGSVMRKDCLIFP